MQKEIIDYVYQLEITTDDHTHIVRNLTFAQAVHQVELYVNPRKALEAVKLADPWGVATLKNDKGLVIKITIDIHDPNKTKNKQFI